MSGLYIEWIEQASFGGGSDLICTDEDQVLRLQCNLVGTYVETHQM